MRRLLILMAALIVIPTGSAEAQSWDAVNNMMQICLTGSLRPCGSVIVKTRWDGVAGINTVEMWVRNEQGGANPDVTGGSFLTQIGLTAPTLEGTVFLGARTEGSVGEVGSPLDHWQLENGGLGGQVTLKAGTFPGKNGALRGCDAPNGTTSDYFITCDDQGHTGWVVFSFATTNNWSANDAQVALKYQSIGPLDLSLECRPGDVGGEHACAPTVVPEPETYALLLTGLIGVLGMSWLRRREPETTDT